MGYAYEGENANCDNHDLRLKMTICFSLQEANVKVNNNNLYSTLTNYLKRSCNEDCWLVSC